MISNFVAAYGEERTSPTCRWLARQSTDRLKAAQCDSLLNPNGIVEIASVNTMLYGTLRSSSALQVVPSLYSELGWNLLINIFLCMRICRVAFTDVNF